MPKNWAYRRFALVVLPALIIGAAAAPAAAVSVPGAPTSLSVRAGDGRVTVWWHAPGNDGGATIGNYAVTVHDNAGSTATGVTGQQTRMVGAPATGFTFLGLTDGTDYRFTVAAINSQGTGTSSSLSGVARPLPRVSIGGASIVEGNTGSRTLGFTLAASAVSSLPASVSYATTDGTATAPSDYATRSGTATIAAGSTTAVVTVPVVGDNTSEANETFKVMVTSPTNANLGLAAGTGTILNDDPAASGRRINIGNASVEEGHAGQRALRLNVSLSSPSNTQTTVKYATSNGTADSSDYLATSGTVTIPAGSTSAAVSVAIRGDSSIEPNETFTVVLTSPTGNATLGRTTGTGTIVNDTLAYPGAPPNLRAIVSPCTGGSDVLFVWDPPTSGGPVYRYFASQTTYVPGDPGSTWFLAMLPAVQQSYGPYCYSSGTQIQFSASGANERGQGPYAPTANLTVP